MDSINFSDLESPLFIAWQINAECNLGCLHCCEEAGHTMPGQLNWDETWDFLRQIKELNIPYVALSGGEPLLHPHFFDICRFIRDSNISLKVETNGEFIDEKIAERFGALKLRSVQISLDGASAPVHERLRLRGDWKKAKDACRLLIDNGVNTEIVFVPTKFNIKDVGELIDLAYSLGVYGVYTGKVMRIGRAAKNWDILCASDKEYEEFFRVLEDKTRQYEGKMKVYYYPYDVIEELKYRLTSPAASLLVIPNGKVKLIGPLPFICGDLRKQGLARIWERYKQAWKDPRVVDWTHRLIDDPKLLSRSNDWIELT
ncbi:MAG: radical SAM protein [Candidatus Omnitrophota bacterium]